MKNITLILVALFTFNFVGGQTTLAEGDIAITGVIADNPDEFSFVLLTDILAGTEIHFTDCGWFATGGFRNYNSSNGRIGEGIVNWTATTDLSCGTEIIITDTGSNTHSATSGAALEVSDTGFNLASAGDQIIAFQGTTESPVFLFAVHFGNDVGWTDVTGTNDSAVPAGLTEGVNAVNLGNFDNSNYQCTVTSNQTLILEAVATVNATNWYQTNSNSAVNRPTLGGCSYTCDAPATCLSTATWNGSWVGTPDLTTEVTISAPYNTGVDGSFQACSLTVDSGATLTVNNGTYIEVENDVTVDDASFINVESSGNFVQNDSNGTFNLLGTGLGRVIKQTPPKAAWYYYTYWSSPVTNETIADAFPNVDGDRRFWFNAANFNDGNGDDIDDNNNDWDYALGGTTMIPGVGYASTEPRFHFPGGTGTATFEGEFNTRDIDVNIDLDPLNPGIKWNFIGNPYPSAIDFVAFHAANSSVLEGVAYFWSQSTPPDRSNPGNQELNFSNNDYATFTVGTGGVAGGVASEIPTGYVASAQGFFIPAITPGTATFTNAMRIANGTSNTQFFKGGNKSKRTNARNPLENRLWVNLTSDNGVFNQILVGYVDHASNENDGLMYDAPKLLTPDLSTVFYSLMDDDATKYVIQGKEINSINEDETIQLGFKTKINVATLYTLSIAKMEGDFLNSHSVFVKDNLLNKVHDLTVCDYTFTSETGEFNNRFEIVFKADALSTANALVNPSQLKIVELENDNVQFTAPNGLGIKTVSLFDLFGRQLYQFNGQNDSEVFNLSNLNSTVFVAKVVLSNGTVISKKAIKK
ncbi:hypothetical protein ABI125_00135 [Tamlana crocina]